MKTLHRKLKSHPPLILDPSPKGIIFILIILMESVTDFFLDRHTLTTTKHAELFYEALFA